MGVEGNYYTLELSVRTNTGMNGRTVHCVSNLNSGMLTVGDAFIILSSKLLDAHACTCVCICVYAHVVVQVYVCVTMYYMAQWEMRDKF